MHLNQISRDKARANIVTSHAVDEDVGGISAYGRLDKLDGGVEVFANIFSCHVLYGHRAIRVILWVHGGKRLVKCNDVCDIVSLQHFRVLRRSNISQVDIVDNFIHFRLFRN